MVIIKIKGWHAYNGDFFLNQHADQRRKNWNNGVMITSNIIVALGVLYSIYHDNLKSYQQQQNNVKNTSIIKSTTPRDTTSNKANINRQLHFNDNYIPNKK